MSHKTLVDTEAVPGANGGINPNDAVLEGIWIFTIIVGSDLVQLSQTNGLVDGGGPLSVGVSLALSVPSKCVNMEKRA